ncbi:hypothetical protein PENSPDRAFT_654662 [Peniophora sp. CONT]|nr:hypothetical protein PENSPDRAFT_654662 [Peniophora sp. CONT]
MSCADSERSWAKDYVDVDWKPTPPLHRARPPHLGLVPASDSPAHPAPELATSLPGVLGAEDALGPYERITGVVEPPHAGDGIAELVGRLARLRRTSPVDPAPVHAAWHMAVTSFLPEATVRARETTDAVYAEPAVVPLSSMLDEMEAPKAEAAKRPYVAPDIALGPATPRARRAQEIDDRVEHVLRRLERDDERAKRPPSVSSISSSSSPANSDDADLASLSSYTSVSSLTTPPPSATTKPALSYRDYCVPVRSQGSTSTGPCSPGAGSVPETPRRPAVQLRIDADGFYTLGTPSPPPRKLQLQTPRNKSKSRTRALVDALRSQAPEEDDDGWFARGNSNSSSHVNPPSQMAERKDGWFALENKDGWVGSDVLAPAFASPPRAQNPGHAKQRPPLSVSPDGWIGLDASPPPKMPQTRHRSRASQSMSGQFAFPPQPMHVPQGPPPPGWVVYAPPPPPPFFAQQGTAMGVPPMPMAYGPGPGFRPGMGWH